MILLMMKLKEDDEGYYDYNTYEHTLNKNTPLIIWSKIKH